MHPADRHDHALNKVGNAGQGPRARCLAEEWPVAFVVNGTTHAVMMATPSDLEDFAIGFALGEAIITAPHEVEEIEIVAHDAGIELRLHLDAERAASLTARRRKQAGPIGCGLCGIESLEEALRPLPDLAQTPLLVSRQEASQAMQDLRRHQPLHDATRAVHAAGFLLPGIGLRLAREDVGRHNALDKLIGALLREGIAPATGAIVMTSRLSTELVQKCAFSGASMLISSALPTMQAVRLAEQAGITLVGMVRTDSAELYCHDRRMREATS